MPTLKIELLPQESAECNGPVSVPIEFQERMPILLEDHVKPEDWGFLCTSLNLELTTLYESQKALSARKFMFKLFLFASIIISSIGISILATSVKMKLAFLILYMTILWLLVTLLLVVPVLIPMYKLNQNHRKNKDRVDRVCRRQSRRHTTVKFKVLYEKDGIFLKVFISTEDDNLESEIADSEPPSEKSLVVDQHLESDTWPEKSKLERHDIEEARSFAQTLEITEASKSINNTSISPIATKIKSMDMNDDIDSIEIKGFPSYNSERLFLSENPIGLDIPAEQNNCDIDSLEGKIELSEASIQQLRSAQTLEITEASKSINYTSISPEATKIKSMDMNDDIDSIGIKGFLSYNSERLFLSENPIGLDIPAEQNNCDIDSLEGKIELPEATNKQ